MWPKCLQQARCSRCLGRCLNTTLQRRSDQTIGAFQPGGMRKSTWTECQWEVPTSELASWGLEDQRQTCWPTSWVAPHQTRNDPNTSIHQSKMVGSFPCQKENRAKYMIPFIPFLFNSFPFKMVPYFWRTTPGLRFGFGAPRGGHDFGHGDAGGGAMEMPVFSPWTWHALRPLLGEKNACQFDETRFVKKTCLAPYRNSCKEISPSPSSIMLNLKKFQRWNWHIPSWVDGTKKAKQWSESCEKLLRQRAQPFQSLKSIRCLGKHHQSQEWWRNPPIFTFEKHSHPVNFPGKKSVFNGSPRGSSTQCPTDSPNHDSRAPKWPTNFAASGCSIQHWTLSKSEHLRDLVAG